MAIKRRIDSKPPVDLPRSGWKSTGLGKEYTAPCGCEIHSYPGGVVGSTGCEVHSSFQRYLCPVCGQDCKTFKALKEHRWEHGY
jgi:hypothetical protein